MLAAMLASASISHADISVTVFEGVPHPDDASNPANFSSALPNAQLTSGAINFDSDITGYSVAQFLNNPTFSNPQNGFNSGDTADNIGLLLTGSLFLNAGHNSFVVEHDDGVTLDINGIGQVVNAPGPTAPDSTPFDVDAPSAGNYDFTLQYTECCGPPAVLVWDINNSPVTVGTPDAAATMPLLGMGMLGLAAFARRIRK